MSGSQDGTRERWWRGVYANTSLVTRIGQIRNGARVTSGPTSSSSAPGLMTRMLEALDVVDGHRVLEIGTGTGYNAALLSHRLGDQNVFTVGVDAELAQQARRHLAEVGYHPKVVTAEGGRVLVDVKASRFDSGYATFMHMRTSAFNAEPFAAPTRDRSDAQRRTTTLLSERVWENAPLWFLLHQREPGRVEFGYSMDPQTGGPGLVFFASADGSWCELSAPRDGTRQVWEGGPRRLWASIEAATGFWHQHDQPGWDRFGLTVASDDVQTVWLDDPSSGQAWALPAS